MRALVVLLLLAGNAHARKLYPYEDNPVRRRNEALREEVRQGKGTVKTVEEMIALVEKAPDAYTRQVLITDLGWSELSHIPGYEQTLLPRLKTIASDYGKDPDLQTRRAAGSLGRDLEWWESRDSPRAHAHQAELERQESRDRLLQTAWLSLAPILVLAVILWSLLSHGLVATLLFKPAHAAGPLADTVALFRESPGALLLPLATAASVGLALSVLLVSVFRDATLHPGMTRAEVQAHAVALVYAPKAIAGYLFAGFVAFMVNAVYLRMLLSRVRGAPDGLLSSLAAALRRAVPIALMSLVVFGGLAALARLRYGPGARLPRRLAQIIDWFAALAESGLMIASAIALAAIAADGQPFREAVKTAAETIRPEKRAFLLASTGAAVLRNDTAAAVAFLPYLLVLSCSLPLMGVLTEGRLSALVGAPAGSDFTILFGLGVLSSAVSASLYFSFVSLLDATLAAGLYLHRRGEPGAKELPIGELRELVRGLE